MPRLRTIFLAALFTFALVYPVAVALADVAAPRWSSGFIISTAEAQVAPPATSPSVPAPAPVAPPPAKFGFGDLAGQILLWVALAFSLPIGALIVGFTYKGMAWMGVKFDESKRQQLQELVVNGLNAGAADAAVRLKGKGEVEINNAIVATGVKYVQAHGAETIKALGLDPNSGEAVQAIKARMATAIADPTVPTPAGLVAPKVGDIAIEGKRV